MIKFLDRLYDFGKISLEDRDREIGKQSGYPKCCIEYALRFFALGIPAAISSDLALGDDVQHLNYIRCPVCRGITKEVLDLNSKMPTRYFNARKIINAYRGL